MTNAVPGRCKPLFLLAAAFAQAACGGAVTSGSGNQEGDAGQTSDAGSNHDDAQDKDTSDAGRPECNSAVVTCRSLPPPCPAGEVPVVAGTCWAGHCVKASACRTVKDCSACDAATDLCVRDFIRGPDPGVRCVELPPDCATDRTCMCLRSHICTVGPYGTCQEIGNGVEFGCDCPFC